MGKYCPWEHYGVWRAGSPGIAVADTVGAMAKDAPETVEEYLDTLPDERRVAIETVRNTILDRLPAGYVEVMRWGMITWEVPLSVEPDTYNGKPLQYAALASQKNHMAVYLNGVYADEKTKEAFLDAYEASGKRMDVGKSCVRFKKLDHLPLDAIGDAIAAFEIDDYVSLVEAAQKR